MSHRHIFCMACTATSHTRFCFITSYMTACSLMPLIFCVMCSTVHAWQTPMAPNQQFSRRVWSLPPGFGRLSFAGCMMGHAICHILYSAASKGTHAWLAGKVSTVPKAVLKQNSLHASFPELALPAPPPPPPSSPSRPPPLPPPPPCPHAYGRC